MIHIFANPSGGAERLSHVDGLMTKYIKEDTTIMVDSATAYVAWCLDNPEKRMRLCRINHKDKEHGFVWYLFIDEDKKVIFKLQNLKFQRVLCHKFNS